jgi:hypothetical protein
MRKRRRRRRKRKRMRKRMRKRKEGKVDSPSFPRSSNVERSKLRRS